jgi:hypothetical protein
MLSKELIETDFDYKIGIDLNYSGLSSFYDGSGSEQSAYSTMRTYRVTDDELDTTFTVLGNLKYEFVEFHSQYGGEFRLNDRLVGGLGLDMAYYSLDTKFTYEDTLRDENGEIITDRFGKAQSERQTLDDDSFSMFRLMYIMPNLKYYFLNDKTNRLFATLDAKIPFSFAERNNLNDSIFLDYGHFELYTGVNYKLISENTTIEFGGGYLFRNEVYNNMFSADLGIYFTKIENTHFYIRASYLQSLEDKNEYDFVATEFATNESMLKINFGVNVLFEPYDFQFDYTHVPYGKNIWVINKLNCSFHYYLK